MRSDLTDFDDGLALDAVDLGVVVLDEQRSIVGWNHWIARVSARSKEDVAGKSFYEVFPSALETRLRSVIDDAFEFGSATVLTHSLNTLLPLKGEGRQELVHNIIVRPLSSVGSKFCLLQIHDVTVAVTRERILRERQNARYRAIVDTAPDAIITANEDGAIQWMNSEAERAFGYAPGELIGRPLTDLVEPDGNLGVAFVEQPTGGASSISLVGRAKNGGTARYDVSLSRWVADGRSFITTIWRDVTDLVEARDALIKSNEDLEARVVQRTKEQEAMLLQLHEAQKMESIGQLTGGLAHDFNNLLGVVLANLTLLKKNIPNEPRNVRLLEGAIQGAVRGATLTKRLLAFARRQELTLETIEIQKLVPDMLELLRHSVGPSVSVEVDISSDVAPVSIDSNQLELALMNVMLNARDAMPDGGTVTITGRNETSKSGAKRPAGLAPGDYVRLSITDTGEGMDEATLAKASEPFFTTKGVGKGTGLGLSMVHGLTAQSGGTMQITSRPGRGTTVSLWLARAKEEKVSQAPERAAQPQRKIALKELRVLLVDDDFLVRMGAADMLIDLGHTVVEADSVAQALKVLRAEGPFDIVVTDYAMPGANGLDLAREIDQITPRLPIVLATGYAELPGGVSPIPVTRLSKPYSQEQLALALRTAVDERVSAN